MWVIRDIPLIIGSRPFSGVSGKWAADDIAFTQEFEPAIPIEWTCIRLSQNRVTVGGHTPRDICSDPYLASKAEHALSSEQRRREHTEKVGVLPGFFPLAMA